jgi:DNA-binding transcriptional regulator YhcF (GntR family)
MDIRVDTTSEVPIRQQLAEQIVFLIATERLKPGEALPSVRELARRMKIHHNTVSEAYQDLVRHNWVQRKRGARLCVPARADLTAHVKAKSLDELINITIRAARELGFPLQSLRERLIERLLSEPPDHVLVVEKDMGLSRIICSEIQQALPWPVRSCTRAELSAKPGLAIGALAIAQFHVTDEVDALLPKDRPVVPIRFASADEHVERVRSLRQPSNIFIVSTSARFLQTARAILAPAVGTRHSLREILLSEEAPSISGADILFCDSIASRMIRSKSRVIEYRLLDAESLAYVAATMKAYLAKV